MNAAIFIVSMQLLHARAGATPAVIREVASEQQTDTTLERIVAEYTDDLERGEAIYYKYNRVDLNGDGIPEVLLRIESRATCGSGGCELLVLQKTTAGYRKVGKLLLTWAPVVVSERKTHGWSDLILWQRAYGDGNPTHYEVRAFDGSKYPQNASAARRLREPIPGVAYMVDRAKAGIQYRLKR